ncbi:MAG TPA: type VI secretion system baseplate subunit TssG [bacterium]|nr:type VI secretion system baseplate subunit TssG [bacterium]
MAGEDRRPPPDLKAELLGDGKSFAFFQAIRLLRYYISRDKGLGKDKDPIRSEVRIRPELSLAHPAVEVEEVRALDTEQPSYRMTANFLGLYGESTPLPTFYSEDLIYDSQEGESAVRDFYDIINYPVYLLFYRIWTKYRPFLKVIDEKDPQYLEILFSMMGLGVEKIREDVSSAAQLLKYIGLLSQFPKSALGLKTLLTDVIEEPSIRIEPCVKRTVAIPEDQRCRLGKVGNVLGLECFVGQVMEDRMGKFRVIIGPLSAPRFRLLMPGTFKFRRILFFAAIYLIDSFDMDLELILSEGEVRTARLGDEFWSQLGKDTWLFSGDYGRQVRAGFELN